MTFLRMAERNTRSLVHVLITFIYVDRYCLLLYRQEVGNPGGKIARMVCGNACRLVVAAIDGSSVKAVSQLCPTSRY